MHVLLLGWGSRSPSKAPLAPFVSAAHSASQVLLVSLHIILCQRTLVHTGSPTALAILYLEVASRVGLCLDPVILPSHVFLRPRVRVLVWPAQPVLGCIPHFIACFIHAQPHSMARPAWKG